MTYQEKQTSTYHDIFAGGKLKIIAVNLFYVQYQSRKKINIEYWVQVTIERKLFNNSKIKLMSPPQTLLLLVHSMTTWNPKVIPLIISTEAEGNNMHTKILKWDHDG